MNMISSSTAATPDPTLLANFQYSKLNRASIGGQSSAAISPVTADGDKVTLSASSSLQASLQTYDFLGRTQGRTLAAQGEEFQFSTSSEFAVSVEGSLDQEELNDIKKLLDTLSSVSKDLFAGRTQAGVQHLAKLDGIDSIASFAANFNYSRQISAATTSQLSATSATQEPQTPGAPTAVPSENLPTSDSFTEQLTRAAKRLDSEEGFDKIPKRFAQLFKKLAHQLRLDDHDETLAKRIEAEHSKRGHVRHADEPSRTQS